MNLNVKQFAAHLKSKNRSQSSYEGDYKIDHTRVIDTVQPGSGTVSHGPGTRKYHGYDHNESHINY